MRDQNALILSADLEVTEYFTNQPTSLQGFVAGWSAVTFNKQFGSGHQGFLHTTNSQPTTTVAEKGIHVKMQLH